MFQYLLILLIILIAYLLFKWVTLPKRQISRYVKLFRSHGYKVAQLPYRPYTSAAFHMIKQDAVLHNDPLYSFKKQFASKDIIVSNILIKPTIVFINANFIKEIISSENTAIFIKEQEPAIFFSIVKNGVFAAEGNSWKKKRRLLSQVFTFDLITSQIPMMVNIADQMFQEFEANNLKTLKGSKGETLYEGQLFKLMVRFTSSVVMSGFLGNDSLKEKYKDESITESILKLSNMGINALKDPLLMIFGQKLVNKKWRKSDKEFCDLRDGVNAVLTSYVLKMEEEGKKEVGLQKNSQRNIIQLLLAQRRKDENRQNQTSDEDLIDEIKTFMIAGTDTTSNFLTAMLLYVFEKPEVTQRLRREINSVIRGNQDITIENMKKLQYLQNVINETSRIFGTSVGLLDRKIAQDSTLCGITIKKGTICGATWFPIFYNPETFQHPFEFLPERWEDEKCRQHLQLPALIFSGGPRGCLGKSLALIEMKVMMIKFMKRYQKLVEHNLQKRAYSFQLTNQIKDTHVTLMKQ